MAWVELSEKRNKRNRTYRHDADPGRFALSCTLATLHYESEIDSGFWDAEIDMTPIRVVNAQFDGWRVTQNGWHYALGKDIASHGDQDGWVGFGGRQGQHWFKFRLLRVGYLHWPTRAWDDIGGAPIYDRANLSFETRHWTSPATEEQVAIRSSTTWSSLWTTPAAGELGVYWRVDGYRLKEEITINQAGREWITANRPPETPLDETWFGFVFRLDWSDVPKCVRAGIQQDVGGDFADDGERIELRDALDRLLGFMPVSDVWVKSGNEQLDRQPLRKRFWLDGDGNHYLLVGIRCDVLNGMAAGDLVFDPDVNYDVTASSDDAHERSDGYVQTGSTSIYIGVLYGNTYDYAGTRFLDVTLPGAATILNAHVTYQADAGLSDTLSVDVYAEDAQDPATYAGGSGEIGDRTPTTNSENWSVPEWVWHGYYDTPDLVDVIQELQTDYDYSSGNPMNIILAYVTGVGDGRHAVSFDQGANDPPNLYIEYQAGGGLGVWMHQRLARQDRPIHQLQL